MQLQNIASYLTPTIVGKIKLDFDQIVQMKTKKEQEALAEGMKEKVGHFRNLRLQTKKYQSDDIRLREEELNLARPEESKVNNPNKLNADKVNLDQTFKEREAAQAKVRVAISKLWKIFPVFN